MRTKKSIGGVTWQYEEVIITQMVYLFVPVARALTHACIDASIEHRHHRCNKQLVIPTVISKDALCEDASPTVGCCIRLAKLPPSTASVVISYERSVRFAALSYYATILSPCFDRHATFLGSTATVLSFGAPLSSSPRLGENQGLNHATKAKPILSIGLTAHGRSIGQSDAVHA